MRLFSGNADSNSRNVSKMDFWIWRLVPEPVDMTNMISYMCHRKEIWGVLVLD